MRHRRSHAPHSDRIHGYEEGSLTDVTFLGSFPSAQFSLPTRRPEIGFIGRSNVGKSSLINAIVKRKTIARTSKTPGKTRDCNVYLVDDRFHLVDLPGYGFAQVSHGERRRFRILVEQYLTRPEVSGIVWLLDIRRELSKDDQQLAEHFVHANTPVLVALTKADKITKNQRAQRSDALTTALGIYRDQAIITSTKDKTGIADLRDAILGLVQR